MRWLAILTAVAAMAGISTAARAGDQIHYGPAPDWVKPVTIPAGKPGASGGIEPLLLDQQAYLGGDGHQHYVNTAFKVLTAQALQEAGTMVSAWDPTDSDLTVIKAEIIRDGQVIDLLAAGEKFTVLRRETNLSRAMIDGTLTAVLEVHGLRIGDVVHFSSLTVGRDLVLGAHEEGGQALGFDGAIRRLYYRQVWPNTVPIRWKATPGYDAVETKTDTLTELVFDKTEAEAPKRPVDAPDRFIWLGTLELTDFKDWDALSTLMAPHFAKASVLTADSPLKAEAQKIKAENKTPEAQALAALRLVEHDVRYLALTMGVGGLIPAQADDTWTRRFGDCKAKTALLIALLNELGIKAEPALVNSDGGDGLDERLPRASMFDHVIVRAEIGGKVYWLDGTRPTDRSLVSLSGVPFRWALPLRPAGAGLEKIELAAPSKPLQQMVRETDVSNGFEGKQPSKVSLLLRGDEALVLDLALRSMARADAEKGLKESYADDAKWLDINKVDFGWDEAEDGLRIEFSGAGQLNWRRQGEEWTLGLSDPVNWTFKERDKGPSSDAPFVLKFPMYDVDTVRVTLPKGRTKFQIVGADADLVSHGVKIVRTSKTTDRTVEVTVTTKSLGPEVSVADAIASNRTLQQSPVSRTALLRYGSEGASTKAQVDTDALLRLAQQNIQANKAGEALPYLDKILTAEPKNTQALGTRSLIYAMQKKYDLELADLKAIYKVAPSASNLLSQGGVLAETGRYREALSVADDAAKKRGDPAQIAVLRTGALAGLEKPSEMLKTADATLDSYGAKAPDGMIQAAAQVINKMAPKPKASFMAALAAEPQSPSARLIQAAVMVKDRAGALAQLDQALLIKPDLALAMRLRITMNLQDKKYEQVLPDLYRLVAMDSQDWRLLTQRAQVYGELKRTEPALKDFDAALKLAPRNSTVLNSSCWVRATANIELERALADCNAAVAISPASSAILDSRGFVNLRLKKWDEAIADYDKSLEGREFAGSLYGRGLAKAGKGKGADGDEDIARAVKLDATVVKTFEGYGLGQ